MSWYKTLRRESASVGEHNDCAVITVATAAGIPYKDAHYLLHSLGRKDRSPTSFTLAWRAMQRLGLDLRTTVGVAWPEVKCNTRLSPNRVRPMPGSPLHKAKTFLTAERVLQRHYRGEVVILRSAGHIACFDGERIQDWGAGRRLRITAIYFVHPRSTS